MSYKCPKCESGSGVCPECGKVYAHGTAAKCSRPACLAMNAPVDCSCGFVVADPPKGVLDLDMNLMPWKKSQKEDAMTKKLTKREMDAKEWVKWLRKYGPLKFYNAFMRMAQDAEGTCVQCKQNVYLDIREGGGVPDWRTGSGDYGCAWSPDTGSEGTGSHAPAKKVRQ